MTLAAVVLAAGQGTRMKSSLPKVLHPLAGRPLVHYALDAVRAAGDEHPTLVVGHGSAAVRAELGDTVEFVLQTEQLGTGHAVLQATSTLMGRSRQVLVTYADMPLLRGETLRALAAAQAASGAAIALASIYSDGLADFGRVVRGPAGSVTAVVEVAQATPEQLALPERNVGAYCFDAAWLWAALPRLPISPKGEYYLTDTVALAVADGRPVEAVVITDEAETIGINTRVHLAQAEVALRARINAGWMTAGVTLVDPASTYIEPGVTIGIDSVIWPNTHLQGQTVLGPRVVIGPNTVIRSSTIGADCRIEASVVEEAWLAEEVSVGPFAHLRKGARLERGVHMGNFGEVKNSTLGPGVKMGHFSYVGDAQIGANVNVSAGVITCNFDGVNKNKTVVGDNAFIGSDTMLVAPVNVGENARTGAGSVVTHDVPAGSLVYGVPAKPPLR
jgi:bifunctional UDP-N-acetylglucosamine pyrophosphorylase/glucosamine-1-phosphate N-acetyltransferase